MKELLAKLLAMHSEMSKRTNAAMLSMQPLDQHQLAGTVSSALREFEWSIERMSEIGVKVDALTASLEAHENEVITAAIADATSNGEILSKETHDGIVAAAKKTAADEVKEEFRIQAEKQALISSRRSEVATAHDAVIAAAMSEDALGEDNFLESAKVLATRADALIEKGITAENSAFPKMLAGSEENFTTFMDLVDDVSKKKPGKPAKPNLTAGKQGGLVPPPAPVGSQPEKSETPSAEDIKKFA